MEAYCSKCNRKTYNNQVFISNCGYLFCEICFNEYFRQNILIKCPDCLKHLKMSDFISGKRDVFEILKSKDAELRIKLM